jgi:hypothetical protein
VGRFLKRVFKLGVLAGAGYAIWRYLETRSSQSGVTWEAQPAPYPPRPQPTEAPTAAPAATPATGAPAGADASAPTDPAPGAPAVDSAAPVSTNGAWVEPVAGTCPEGYPVKAKMSSGIYHVKGGLSYGRTTPDRCYRDVETAEADGLRPAKR